MKLRRLLLLLLASVVITGLTACGDDGPQKTAESEGTYVTIGDLQYQVQISRQLNPHDVEDRDYLTGVVPADASLTADQVWFGIFIRVKNPTAVTRTSASLFTLEDTVGAEYEPTPARNIIGYKAAALTPGDLFPHANETAAYGPTQGKLLLFKVTNRTLDNRPLEMRITGVDGDTGAIRIDV